MQEIARGVHLQPFQPPPLNREGKKEGRRKRNDGNVAREIHYSKHNSSNSRTPSNRKPAKGCIKNWLSTSESV